MTAETDTTASTKEATTEENRTATGADILEHMRRVDRPVTAVDEAAADLDADPDDVRATLRNLERDGVMWSREVAGVRLWWFEHGSCGNDLEELREQRRTLREIIAKQ